jgi:hypothetical protein
MVLGGYDFKDFKAMVGRIHKPFKMEIDGYAVTT